MRIGLAQMLVVGGEPQTNLQRARRMISEAARGGCCGVVLPECCDLGWMDSCALTLAEPIPGGGTVHELCQAARMCGIYVAVGLTERSGDKIHNTAVLISPEGELLLKHRKISELSIARDLYSTGQSLAVADTALGRVAIPICADLFPDSLVLGKALARMGAKLLLSPCAWAVEPEHDNERNPYGENWRTSYRTLARECSVATIGVSNVGVVNHGPWKGHKCIGCSLAVGADASILASGPYGSDAEALLTVEV